MVIDFYLWTVLDIEECMAGTYTCPDNAVCDNRSPDYDCYCDIGYVPVYDTSVPHGFYCLGELRQKAMSVKIQHFYHVEEVS